MARKVDAARWEADLRMLGVKGKLPSVLTQAVVDTAQRRPAGERCTLTDGKVPGLVLDVAGDGSAAFTLAYRTAAGVRRRQGLGSARAVTLEQARAEAEKVRGLVRGGVDPVEQERHTRLEAQRAATSTLRAYLRDVYAPKVLAHRKDGGAPSKPEDKGSGTYARVMHSWETLLDVQLAQVSRDAIEKVLSDRKASGLEAGTLLRDWSALRALLADAVDRGQLVAVPLVKRPEPIRKLRGNQRVRYLGQKDPEKLAPGEKGERQRFDEALAAFTSDEPGGGDFLRFAAGLALSTGMRRGEIVRLTEKLINKRERRIELTAQITKSNKARTVYLSDAALAALELWKIRGRNGELCPGEGEREEVAERWEDRITQREWPRLCAAAQLEDFHFHDCRHDYAVRLLRSGATLAQVRDALGHASVTQTEKYAHVIPSDVRNAVLALGRRAS